MSGAPISENELKSIIKRWQHQSMDEKDEGEDEGHGGNQPHQ